MRLRPWSEHSYRYLVQNGLLESWVVSWKARWAFRYQVLCYRYLNDCNNSYWNEWFSLGLEDLKVPLTAILTSCNTAPFCSPHDAMRELGRPGVRGEAIGREEARTAKASPHFSLCMANFQKGRKKQKKNFTPCEPTTVTEQQQTSSFPTTEIWMRVLSCVAEIPFLHAVQHCQWM